jgi:uncharacterized phage protein gp47/JayE
MPFFPRSKDDMVANGLRVLRDYSNINRLSPGAKARLILDSFTDEHYGQHELFDENMAQAFIRWADEQFLDYFGDMLNIPRLQATTATALIEDQNFVFYVDGGTFGDLNNGLDFVIPSGTTITTPDFPIEKPTYATDDYRPRQNIITYDLVDSVTCSSNRSFVFANIRARIEGVASDIPRNVLSKHNFTSYTLGSSNRLKCSNRYAIANGSNRETDQAYRYRLMNSFKARERANKIAIRLAALSVPGVADVIEVNCEQGPGTFSLYVKSLTPTTSPGLIRRVTDVVNEVCSYGVRSFVLAPNILGLELVIAVQSKSTATASDKANAYAAIRQNIENNLNNIDIGEEVNLEDLASLVTLSHPSIQGIGITKAGSFEEVYLYRTSSDNAGVKKVLFTDTKITPLYNEKIVLETGTKYRGIKFL